MCILPVAQTLSKSASLTVFQKALLLMTLFSFKFAEYSFFNFLRKETQ